MPESSPAPEPTSVPEPAEGRASTGSATTSVAGRTVLIAGATSASGHAVADALLKAGARVIAVGSNAERLAAMATDRPAIITETADLTDEAAVLELAMGVHSRVGRIDGLIHLVGGWRGGGGLAGQADADFRTLEISFTALRHISRTFDDDIIASSAGRLAIVSSDAVLRPTAGGANYVAVKAASEAWTRAIAQGYAKAGDRAAAIIYRVKSLAGLEADLAASVVALWDSPATTLNATVVPLGA